MSRAKNGKSSLTITSNDEDAAYQLIFNNNPTFRRCDRNPINAYLEVTRHDGKTFGEALLYLYERTSN